MDEGLGGLFEVPLQMAAEPGVVVENAEQLGLAPLSVCGKDPARALVKVQVPEAVHVGDLVRALLTRLERLAVRGLAMAMFAGAQEALPLHEAAHGGVARHRTQARVLAGERDEVVVVQLEAPARMVAMLLGDGLGQGGAETRVGPGMRGESCARAR